MDFDKLTRDLETQDATIKLCAEAIRKRAEYLSRTGYTSDTVALVRNVALWLESEQGRGLVLDLSIKEQLATAPCDERHPIHGRRCQARGPHDSHCSDPPGGKPAKREAIEKWPPVEGAKPVPSEDMKVALGMQVDAKGQ